MEDIILVTGTHRARSCTNVVFPGGREDAQASFGINLGYQNNNVDEVVINWQYCTRSKAFEGRCYVVVPLVGYVP
jgi:hypothetical protein